MHGLPSAACPVSLQSHGTWPDPKSGSNSSGHPDASPH